MRALPKEVEPQQVRAALYAVIKRQVEAPGTFDKDGWLQIGFYGHQPAIGESYISTGSLYLCAEAFLMLGLPESDPFWQGKDLPWTQRKYGMEKMYRMIVHCLTSKFNYDEKNICYSCFLYYLFAVLSLLIH